MYRAGLVERAYEIAKSGRAAGTPEIEVLLSREGYIDVRSQLSGRVLREALRVLCIAARRPRHEIDDVSASSR